MCVPSLVLQMEGPQWDLTPEFPTICRGHPSLHHTSIKELNTFSSPSSRGWADVACLGQSSGGPGPSSGPLGGEAQAPSCNRRSPHVVELRASLEPSVSIRTSSGHRDFPGGPVVKTPPSGAGGVGLIPGGGAKIPHAAR